MAEQNAIRKILRLYQFVKDTSNDTSSLVYKTQFTVLLNDLFKYYTTVGIRIILTIDEFDRAQTLFKDGQFFQKLFGLSPKGSPTRLNLSIITLSRRRVSTIAHHMQEGSNFEDAYPPLPLKGFANRDLEAYFDTYRSLPCGYPTEDAKKQILYLCGRSPELLMKFRHEAESLTARLTDVSTIYAEHGQFIQASYNRVITLLESSFADRNCERPLTDIFIQQFIGPVCDENFDVELPLLYDHGFVTKATDEDNIFVQSGVSDSSNPIVYEPISPYFIEYMKYMVLPQKLSSLSGMLVKAEKLTREIIQKEMRAAYPGRWESIVNTYAEKKDYYLDTLRERALQNDFSSGNISKLNVISFKEYYYIMRDNWRFFAKYFSAYPDQRTLRDTMAFLNEVRNDSAHLNLSVYNSENRRRIWETCSKFIESIEAKLANSMHPGSTR